MSPSVEVVYVCGKSDEAEQKAIKEALAYLGDFEKPSVLSSHYNQEYILRRVISEDVVSPPLSATRGPVSFVSINKEERALVCDPEGASGWKSSPWTPSTT